MFECSTVVLSYRDGRPKTVTKHMLNIRQTDRKQLAMVTFNQCGCHAQNVHAQHTRCAYIHTYIHYTTQMLKVYCVCVSTGIGDHGNHNQWQHYDTKWLYSNHNYCTSFSRVNAISAHLTQCVALC